MQVRRVLRALALVLVVGTSPSVAVAPASATATSPQTSASEPDSASPRELDLVVGVTPNTTALTLHAVADDWAA